MHIPSRRQVRTFSALFVLVSLLVPLCVAFHCVAPSLVPLLLSCPSFVLVNDAFFPSSINESHDDITGKIYLIFHRRMSLDRNPYLKNVKSKLIFDALHKNNNFYFRYIFVLLHAKWYFKKIFKIFKIFKRILCTMCLKIIGYAFNAHRRNVSYVHVLH